MKTDQKSWRAAERIRLEGAEASVATYRKELESLAFWCREVDVIDACGETLARGFIYSDNDGWYHAGIGRAFPFHVDHVADIAGTVIELRGGVR